MSSYILFVHVLIAIAVICFVLLQRGKGAEAGAAFGGASQSIFGASGSGNFLTKTTSILMTAFFVTSLALVHIAKTEFDARTQLSTPEAVTQPAESLPIEETAPVLEGLE